MIAARLHKTIVEMNDVPVEEYVGWIAHFGLEHEDSK